MSKPLTDHQRAIHGFMRRYQQANARPPSVREVAASIGSPWPNAVTSAIRLMVKKGFIRELGPGTRRYLAVMPEAVKAGAP